METIGGSAETILKKENGAPFTVPDGDWDVTNAIGLGMMLPMRNL
jgi:hypothetical protein